jgi:hypothetical protein
MVNRVNCKSCGQPLGRGAAFCGKCGAGAPLEAEAGVSASAGLSFSKVIFAPPRMLIQISKDVLRAKSRWIRFGAPIMIALLVIAALSARPDKDSTKPLEAGSAPVAAAALSDSELQYMSRFRNQIAQVGASMGRFTDLTAHPDFLSDDWKNNVNRELILWQITYTEAQKVQPPARFAAVQGCWVGALGVLNDAGAEIASGLDRSDAEYLNGANGTLSRANDTVKACVQEAHAALGR